MIWRRNSLEWLQAREEGIPLLGIENNLPSASYELLKPRPELNPQK